MFYKEAQNKTSVNWSYLCLYIIRLSVFSLMKLWCFQDVAFLLTSLYYGGMQTNAMSNIYIWSPIKIFYLLFLVLLLVYIKIDVAFSLSRFRSIGVLTSSIPLCPPSHLSLKFSPNYYNSIFIHIEMLAFPIFKVSRLNKYRKQEKMITYNKSKLRWKWKSYSWV